MADKLSVTIALEGGKEIEQSLAGIGKAGQQAFKDISKAAEQAGGFDKLKPEEVTEKLKEMGIVGTEAFNKIQAAVNSAARMERLVSAVRGVEQGFAKLSETASKVSSAISSIGNLGAIGILKQAIDPVIQALKDASEAIGRVDAAAIKMGKSIEEFDRMRLSAEKAGASVEGFSSAMDTLAEGQSRSGHECDAEIGGNQDLKTFQDGLRPRRPRLASGRSPSSVWKPPNKAAIQDAAAQWREAAARAELEQEWASRSRRGPPSRLRS